MEDNDYVHVLCTMPCACTCTCMCTRPGPVHQQTTDLHINMQIIRALTNVYLLDIIRTLSETSPSLLPSYCQCQACKKTKQTEKKHCKVPQYMCVNMIPIAFIANITFSTYTIFYYKGRAVIIDTNPDTKL